MKSFGIDTINSVSLLSDYTVLSILVVGILAPINEEIIFRYSIFDSLKRFEDVWKVFISSLIFAIGHPNFHGFGFIFYFIMALIFSISYVKTRNIYTPIIVHISINLVARIAKFIVFS